MYTLLSTTLNELKNTHPDFDVLSANLLDQQVVNTLGLNADTLSMLRTWQRLVRIAPDDISARVLFDSNIDSAQQLTSMSRTTFMRTFGSKFGDEDNSIAKQVYNNALQVKDQTMHLLASVHGVVASRYYTNLSVNHVDAGVTDYFESLSDYQKIFGSLNFCSCDECKSIFGAAAYFVDLMRIIDKAITVPNSTGPDPIPADLTLQARRPDLWQIELTCANTTTMVPYLQIVNEILENTVVNSLIAKNPGTNPAVWPAMAQSVYPFNTPYNQPLSQIRILLQQFNMTLASVIAAFDPQRTSPLGLAVETLNLNYESYQLIKTSDTSPEALSLAYGTPITSADNGGLDHLDYMLAQTALDRSAFIDLLHQSLTLKERTGVNYTYTPTLFGTKLILVFYGDNVAGSFNDHEGTLQGTVKDNLITGTWSMASVDPPDNQGAFQFTLTADRASFTGKWMKGYDNAWEDTPWNGEQTCSTQGMTLAHQLFINQGEPGNICMDITINNVDPLKPYEQITNLTHDTLDRINRFVRLAATMSWDYETLDWIMTTLGFLEINDACLTALANIKALADRFNIPPTVLSACWFDTKTRGMGDDNNSQALFDIIFNDPALIRVGVDLDYYHPVTILTPGETQNALFYNPTYLSVPANWIVSQSLYEDEITVAKVTPDPSALTYGRRILSGIKATNNDLLAIASFFFPNKSSISLGVSNLSLLYRHTLLPDQLGITVTDYLVLLRLIGKQDASLLMPDDIKTIADVADWMKKAGFNVYELDYILNGNTSLYLNTGYTADSLLAFLTSMMVSLETQLVIKSGFISNAITADVSEAFFNYFSANAFVNDKGVILQPLTDAEKAKITQLILPNGTVITPTSDQLNDAQQKLNQEYSNQQRLVISGLAGFFNASSELTGTEINGIASIQKIASVVAMFVSDNGNGGPAMQKFILMFAQHLLMAKRISLTADELNNVYQYPQAYLSVQGDVFNFTPLLLSNVQNIWKMKSLVYTFQDTKNRFITYLALASTGNVTKDEMKKLCELTGWNAAQCEFVCYNIFGTNKMCQTVSQIYEVNTCFELGKQIGLDMYFLKSLAELQLLPAGPPNNWLTFTDRSNALTGALRAHFGDDAWESVFKKYNGPLLEQQRNVLEAFCLWKLGGRNGTYKDITSSRNLYEFLLIDVDMSGCSEISYIRQALNSAQLYLQRCRLNLERNVSISTDDIPNSWWIWLMSYRIWEANRQVFLYPENYLDPSLRKTKTSLFKQLENDLSQGEVTKASADNAYKKYLDNFSDLAKLQYVDACQYTVHDPNLGANDTLFLFTRTQTDPSNFYYITRQAGSVWSEWMPINITIPSAYITPVYVFNRLFIFWVELSSAQDNDPTTTAANAQCTVVKASVKYSFIDFSGNWTQPQALIDNHVINVASSVSLYGPFDRNLFGNDKPYWHKVSATPVDKSNFTDPEAGRLSGQKLVISYGPLLSTTGKTSKLTPPTYTNYYNASINSFENTIGNAVSKYNQEISASINSQLPLNQTVIIDDMLNPSWLMNQSEFVYYADDIFGAQTTPSFQAGFDTVSGSLILLPTSNTIATNYTEGMNLQPLVALTPGLANSNSFVGPGITSADSQKYFGLLQTAKVINQDGSVTPNIANYSEDMIQSILFVDNATICRYVRDVLFQVYYGSSVLLGSPQASGIGVLPVRNAPCSFLFLHPAGTFLIETSDAVPEITDALQIATAFGWVKDTAFTNSGLDIDDTLSRNIYVGLQASSIRAIDSNGIVRLAFSRTLTPDMISGILRITDLQAQWVINILISSGRTSMQYLSNTVDIDLNCNTLEFTSTRLTTGAVDDLSKRLFAQGVDGVLQLNAQQAPINIGHCFGDFDPGQQLSPPEAFYDNQVAFSGPYGYYYWELFYYAPTLIASQLNNNKQFNDSELWYQYIFNPTIPPFSLNGDSFINNDITKTQSEQFFTLLTKASYISSAEVTAIGSKATVPSIANVLGLNLTIDPDGKNLRTAREMQNMLRNNYLANPLGRYWQFNPFRNRTIASIKSDLQNPAQIKIYNDDPFDPDAIGRLRIGAYEKNIVMQYIDNLLDWGDMEFTQYTWESITTATMLYVYAYDLLGSRPQDLGPCSSEPDANFADIQQHYKGSEIPQFLIDLESSVGALTQFNTGQPGKAYNDLDVYFCVPDNAQFMGYWDRVEDRLYKIRHCLNINGVAQPLPLFDPPIDPMQLVKAASSGNGVLNVQNLFQPAVPYYRFTTMLAKAYSVTNAVIQLGNSLLSVLEKNDAEGLALLNSSQQAVLLNMTTMMKQQQIDGQTNTIDSMNEALQSAQYRQTYYTNLINGGLSTNEFAALMLSAESIPAQLTAQGIRGVSIAGYLAPNIFGFADGGMQFGEAINTGAQLSEGIAAIMNQSASVLATMAQYARRKDEWVMQQQIAQYDVLQITQQLAAAQIQLAYNKQDLAVNQKSIDQVNQVDAFLRGKFTNQELYQWMIGRLSSLYYNTYQLAVNTVLATQTAYQYEMDNDSSFINYSYWDSLRKGLLAGEGLMLSLQQMENSYLNNNPRHFEIEKTISLKQLFPQEFLKFKWGHDNGQQGVFNFTLGEQLFDFDFPAHYCRKIKTLSISLPAVIGPYQNLNATLTQNSNSVLLKPNPNAVNYLIYTTSATKGGTAPATPASDVLRSNWMPNQQIAISTGVDDTGLFQLDFNDERYLPFEGTGAVSSWTFNLPTETNRINFDSITDVIVKLRYTAIDGGTPFGSNVKAFYASAYPQYMNLKAKCMEMNQTYADAWYRMFVTAPVANIQRIVFKVTDNYLLTTLKNVVINSVMVQIEASDNAVINAGTGNEFMQLTIGTGNPQAVSIADNFGELASPDVKGDGSNVLWSLSFDITKTPGALLTNDMTALDPKKFIDMALVVVYQANAF